MKDPKRPLKEVNRLKEYLPNLTENDKKEAFEKIAEHKYIHDSKGQNHCLMCGHQWKGKGEQSIVCPHCGREVKLLKTSKRFFEEKAYFAMAHTLEGFQIEREFKIELTQYRYAEPKYWIREVYQRWIKPGYKDTIVSLARNSMSYYIDCWNWSSKLNIRNEGHQHHLVPWCVVGTPEVTPELRRNGFDNDFHGMSPRLVFENLLTNNKFETLWKLGMFNVLEYWCSRPFDLSGRWRQLMIVNKHKYHIEDVGLWDDMLDNLRELGKDITNPVFICPSNLKESHDHWLKKVKEQRKKLERMTNFEKAQKFEKTYHKAKEKYLGLIFTDAEISVMPLQTVREFVEEGDLQHHCVFANGYYKREDCLIMHAIRDGVSIATIEFNLENMRIIQCRGKFNKVPEHKERIENLIMSNVSKIAKCQKESKKAEAIVAA